MIPYYINYTKAFTEFSCLLQCLPQTYIKKLPKKLIVLVENQINEQYKIEIDTQRNILEQNLSKETKDLIAVIKYNYWSTELEKEQIKESLYKNLKK